MVCAYKKNVYVLMKTRNTICVFHLCSSDKKAGASLKHVDFRLIQRDEKTLTLGSVCVITVQKCFTHEQSMFTCAAGKIYLLLLMSECNADSALAGKKPAG